MEALCPVSKQQTRTNQGVSSGRFGLVGRLFGALGCPGRDSNVADPQAASVDGGIWNHQFRNRRRGCGSHLRPDGARRQGWPRPRGLRLWQTQRYFQNVTQQDERPGNGGLLRCRPAGQPGVRSPRSHQKRSFDSCFGKAPAGNNPACGLRLPLSVVYQGFGTSLGAGGLQEPVNEKCCRIIFWFACRLWKSLKISRLMYI
mmetsp:Transcript_8356/g.17322  ORF Transcript_8356/g.17322 Transcript_8356/m.17322 type:complete len:201 (-) Transcript_8356:19-621(-)